MASINNCSKVIRIVGTGLMGLGVVFQGLGVVFQGLRGGLVAASRGVGGVVELVAYMAAVTWVAP